MSKSTQLKAALVTSLVVAALLSRYAPSFRPASVWFILGLLAFGTVNVLLAAPGTEWIRATAIGASFAGLLWPAAFGGTVMLLAWLLWPPAFMVAWAVAGETAGADRSANDAAGMRARISLAALIGAVAVASIAYRLLVAHNLQQTAA